MGRSQQEKWEVGLEKETSGGAGRGCCRKCSQSGLDSECLPRGFSAKNKKRKRSKQTHPRSLNLSTSSPGFLPPIQRIWLNEKRVSERARQSDRHGGGAAAPGLPELREGLREVRQDLIYLNGQLSRRRDDYGSDLPTWRDRTSQPRPGSQGRAHTPDPPAHRAESPGEQHFRLL